MSTSSTPPGAPNRTPVAGAPVFTRDGAALGEVTEVADQSFKVAAPHGRDYWLSSEFVLLNTAACVELDFDVEMLEDYKLPGPAPVAAESPILDAETESFDSTAEHRQRRRAMEHGYGHRRE